MGLLQVSDCKRGAFGEDYGLEFCGGNVTGSEAGKGGCPSLVT